MYYIYMLRCEDESIYTGITTDLNRRMEEHFTQNEKCSKYTMRHHAKKLENAWTTENRVLASKLEYHIKKSLSKKEKEELIQKPRRLKALLGEKIESSCYKNIKKSIKGNRI